MNISEIYQHFAAQAEPWAIATTSIAALASDIADLIGVQPVAGAPTDEDGTSDLYFITRQVQAMAAEAARISQPQHRPTYPKVSAEDLYKVACYRHWLAQQPASTDDMMMWHGCAAGLAWLLKSRGLSDAQIDQMETDGIECGQAGRWAGIIEALDQPDGTVPHND